jgi:hypothetical protein
MVYAVMVAVPGDAGDSAALMVALPVATAVASPVLLLIVATTVLLLLHETLVVHVE